MIRVGDLSVRVGDFHLDGVSFALASGEYVALMGKTGSGKTTLLECLCGLRPLLGGRIELAGREVTNLRPAERGIGYVPQDGALFPKQTVRENLAFPLLVRRSGASDIDARISELAGQLELGSLLDRWPETLSGGERQRVAIGRALSFRPKILLLDEPLAALDEQSRDELREVLNQLRIQQAITTLHVTHSRTDAIRLADRVLQIADGRIVDADPCESPVPPTRPCPATQGT